MGCIYLLRQKVAHVKSIAHETGRTAWSDESVTPDGL